VHRIAVWLKSKQVSWKTELKGSGKEWKVVGRRGKLRLEGIPQSQCLSSG
jgi:hypothetical protein